MSRQHTERREPNLVDQLKHLRNEYEYWTLLGNIKEAKNKYLGEERVIKQIVMLEQEKLFLSIHKVLAIPISVDEKKKIYEYYMKNNEALDKELREIIEKQEKENENTETDTKEESPQDDV